WAGGPGVFADWNEIDMIDSCKRLLFAGSDTTTLSIGNAFHALLTDPALMAEVRAGGEKRVERLVEEILRLYGSVHFRPRRVAEDVVLGGQTIAKGSMILVMLLAANRDPEEQACPHQINLDRKGLRNHLSFAI